MDFLEFIKQVKSANDIVNVVGSYKQLDKRGQAYWTCCPFHSEKTPSFCVSPNKQIFNCFGCGESGDVIKFVEKIESCSFFEALEILAKKANLEVPKFKGTQDEKQLSERKKRRDTYFSILKETARFYYKVYYSKHGEHARNYMAGRGFKAETAKKFGIGFSPDTNSLPEHLKKLGFKLEMCKEIGVLQQTKNGQYLDALFERLIVPIFDINKNVIAFGGRALSAENERFGKYKNTSETPLFSKKNNLYAINFAKEQKQQGGISHLIMMEGYMDVIAMHEAGFFECVASMGTSLTISQAKLISRLTNNVYICYDGDSAGQKATLRGLDILASIGLEVKVVSIPNKLDPDEFVKKEGKDAFNKLLQNALPLVDYKLKVLEEQFGISKSRSADSNRNMTKFAHEAVELLKTLDDISRKHYVSLISQKSGLSEDFLERKVQEKVIEGISEEQKTTTEVTLPSMLDSALCFVANAVLSNQPYAKLEQKPSCQSGFLSQVFDYIFDCYKNNEIPKADMIFTVIPNQENSLYMMVCGYEFLQENKERDEIYFEECKRIVESESLKRRRKLVLDELLREGLSDERRRELTEEIQKLNQEINN